MGLRNGDDHDDVNEGIYNKLGIVSLLFYGFERKREPTPIFVWVCCWFASWFLWVRKYLQKFHVPYYYWFDFSKFDAWCGVMGVEMYLVQRKVY